MSARTHFRLKKASHWLAVLGLAMTANSQCVFAGDASAGKKTFREQCSLCHSAESNDGGGAQGPNLNDVFGRRAATFSTFTYTAALKASGLTWDAVTLDRFLTSPTSVVPGSAMGVAVPNKVDRDDLIAFFHDLKEGTFKADSRELAIPIQWLTDYLTEFGCHAPLAEAERQLQIIRDGPKLLAALGCQKPTPKGVHAEWKDDAPGRMHRIDLALLPPPYATPLAANSPTVVAGSTRAKLRVPRGFHVNVFANSDQVQAPRALRVGPNGDVFLSETQTGRVKVLRPTASGTNAATSVIFAQGLMMPFGMAFYPAGDNPQWLYVAETNRVVRYAYRVGDLSARGVPEIVVPQLSPVGGGHSTRDLVFSADGKRMFVSVGSQSNAGEDMPKKTAAGARVWEAEYGLGAAWGNETRRADVLVFDVGSNEAGKVFASGLRNCVGLTIEPRKGDVWCTVNERDRLGDDLVPDFSTRLQEGGFYGWPWYYMGHHEDPRLKGDRPDLAGKVIVPDVPFQAHSAALNLIFYPASISGGSAFPPEYRGDGFAVLHGSWNRAIRTGHKVVRILMKHGVPTGEYQDFMTGFIIDNEHVWGRPVGGAVARDGSLLISDDGANLIYRISYRVSGSIDVSRH